MDKRDSTFFNRFFRITGFAVLGLFAAAFFSAVFAVVVKYLWNWLLPELFGFRTITFLQGFGLIILTRLLVGGWHRGPGFPHRRPGRHPHMHGFMGRGTEGSPEEIRMHNIRRFMERETGGFPEEIRMNRNVFMKFWEENGRNSFLEFLKKYNDTEDLKKTE